MGSSGSPMALALAAALTLPACFVGGDEVVLAGFWESTESVGGRRNSLEVDEDLTGTATIYFYYGDDDPSLYYADYVVVASTIEDDVSYRVSMICDDDCSALDFTMICRVIEGTYLDCTGSDLFSSYDVLHFKRRSR